ncbi:MAG: exosortase system-associated protein, TIGR04073 family [Candidatus Omnitrophica bacterium]|nr:exosortase system-associated protein, TIGR04073 family [Candidatus Omnitrophota bacterium]
MRIRSVAVAVVLTLVLMGAAGPAFAEQETGALVVSKLFRGIVNAATGWIEIPKQTSLVWQESGPATGLSWGFLKGIAYAVARSVAGGYEIVTFPVPIPEDYRPLMQPEYVLSDMQGVSSPGRKKGE